MLSLKRGHCVKGPLQFWKWCAVILYVTRYELHFFIAFNIIFSGRWPRIVVQCYFCSYCHGDLSSGNDDRKSGNPWQFPRRGSITRLPQTGMFRLRWKFPHHVSTRQHVSRWLRPGILRSIHQRGKTKCKWVFCVFLEAYTSFEEWLADLQ